MKKIRFVAMFVAMVMLFSMTTMVTTASAIHIVEDEAQVYVDGRIRNVDAYLDSDGDIRVYEVEELYEILPKLEENVTVLPSRDGYVIIEYLKFVDYGYEQKSNRLYIYTDESYSDIIDISVIEPKPCDIFVNGVYVATSNVYLSGDGEVYLVGFGDVFKIFPKETTGMKLPVNSTSETLLADWCSQYGYSMTRVREHVFVNNRAMTPVEVRIGNQRVEFPDQQPVIVLPGRTMIPVASIAEMLGCKVTWDGMNRKVTIEKGNSQMILWLNNQNYWLNGSWHKMDTEPFALNGRTMVPLAFITKAFNYGLTTSWENGVFVISLSSNW